MTNRILGFRGKYRFLSNFDFYEVRYGRINYPTSEHAYQAQKTLDEELRKGIAKLRYPREAKHAGRALKLRDDWTEELSIKIMKSVVRKKYRMNPYLIKRLLKSGDAYLEETNDWGDTFWGCIVSPRSGRHIGRNELGKIHMELREEFRNEGQDE